MKPTGSFYLMAATQNMPYLDIFLRKQLTVLSRIVWSYDSSGVQAKRFFGSLYEPILHCVKNPNAYTFNAADILIEAKTGAARKLIDDRKPIPTPYNTMKVPGNVWTIPRVRYRMQEYEEHPTQKPIALLERIVLASSNSGDTVLDPFSGTFTTDAFRKTVGMTHAFEQTISRVLKKHFNADGETVFSLSPLLGYLNHKPRSANRGSKARSSFANLYALYVLIEDYLNGGYARSGNYASYSGADFSPLLRRMRELPFGQKLQNHALNNRTNDEFHKYYPDDIRRPITRKVDIQKYWINESLLVVEVSGRKINIARAVLEIIDEYVKTKQHSFEQFIHDCEVESIFVMRPLGRFFQVTETLDVRKYFLDIDKIERYPVTFVVKTNLSIKAIRERLEDGARAQYVVDTIVQKYMQAIEEIINVPRLLQIFDQVVASGRIRDALDEIIRWSKVEFNYMDGDTHAGTVVDTDEDDEQG